MTFLCSQQSYPEILSKGRPPRSKRAAVTAAHSQLEGDLSVSQRHRVSGGFSV